MAAGVVEGLVSLGQIGLIIVPVMIFLEMLKETGVLEFLNRRMSPYTRLLGLPGSAVPALSAGLVFGLTFGSGIVIQTAREGRLTRAELTLLCLFLSICHAVIEETVIFLAIGADGLLILAVRLVVAVLLTASLARLLGVLAGRSTSVHDGT